MSGPPTSRVFSVTTLGWPQDEVAKSIMQFLVQRIEPILRHRGWLIGVLKEFYPRGASLLGLNYEKGKEVCIRLRVPGDKNRFLPFHEVVCTALHEVAHCEFSKHDRNFWNLYYQLVKDCEKMELSLIERGVPLYPPHVAEHSPPEAPKPRRGAKRPRSSEAQAGTTATNLFPPVVSAVVGEGHRLGGRTLPLTADSASSAEQQRRRLLAEAALRRMQGGTALGSRLRESGPPDMVGSHRGPQILPDEVPLSLTPKKESNWICPRCTYENAATDKECAMCSDDTRGMEEDDTHTHSTADDQPWSCPTCTFLNEASADACDMCQTLKKRTHTASPETSVVVVDDDESDESDGV